jgi:hypothetical protein
MKVYITREKIVNKLLYPIINSRFEISGLKMGLDGGKTLQFERTQRFKFNNECVAANYVYHGGKKGTLQVEA